MIQFFTKSKLGILVFFGLGLLCAFSCNTSPKVANELFDYGTKSDSARYYYQQGWQCILDLGQWTKSEAAFRKAMNFDKDFILGKSLVGRISQDLTERQQLLAELQQEKQQASPDERLLLDCYLRSIEFMNLRDQGLPISEEQKENRKEITLKNHQTFAHKYPENDYEKAEYIELLHAYQGAEVALDSLKTLANIRQRKLPFFIGYEAILEAELGNFEEALMLANQLKNELNAPNIPAVPFIYGNIYMEMDSLTKAAFYINKTVKLDANHLIAQGLKRQIKAIKID